MQIIHGKQVTALKIIVYGPEGIGKSTFASHFPLPVFIDTEGSTKFMDVDRTPAPKSWPELIEQVKYFRSNPHQYKTLVLDTADWAEQLCIQNICASKKLTGIEDMGYGKGYVYLAEEFGKLLNILEDVVKSGVNVVITAHAMMRKFEQPDELGAYDRWELKLQKKTAPLVKEWADNVFFANYETHAVSVDKQGNKFKAQGGKRVMYTSHNPCWDAKNRHSLPEKLAFDYGQITHLFAGQVKTATVQPQPAPPKPAAPAPVQTVPPTTPVPNTVPVAKRDNTPSGEDGIPEALLTLLHTNNILESEVQEAVAKRGYFPADMPVKDYPKDFIDGVLIGAWDQVKEMIESDPDRLPF